MLLYLIWQTEFPVDPAVILGLTDLETVFGHLSVGKFDHLEQLLDDVPDVNVQVHGYCFIHMAVVHFQVLFSEIYI